MSSASSNLKYGVNISLIYDPSLITISFPDIIGVITGAVLSIINLTVLLETFPVLSVESTDKTYSPSWEKLYDIEAVFPLKESVPILKATPFLVTFTLLILWLTSKMLTLTSLLTL